jgi:putative endonuclease
MPITRRRAAGDRFEELARAALCRAGLVPVTKNFNTRYGELDLVMREGNVTVFVEVRYRAASRFLDAVATVTTAKQQRLIRAAQVFLGEHPALARQACRFDVVGFDGPADAPVMRWCRNAFDAG